MNTTIKEALTSRLMLVVLALALVMGMCAPSLMGMQKKAWADNAEGEVIASWEFENGRDPVPVTGEDITIMIASGKAAISNTGNEEIINTSCILVLEYEDGTSESHDIEGVLVGESSEEFALDSTKTLVKATLSKKVPVTPSIPTTYTVTFDANGHGTAPEPIQSDETGLVDLTSTEMTCEGWDFVGWFTNPDLKEEFDATEPLTKDITLYAGWAEQEAPEAKTYTVTFDANGHGTAPEPIKSDETGLVDLTGTEMTCEGWDFVGWFTNPDFKEEFDASEPLTKDITLYAGWAEQKAPENGDDEKDPADKNDKPAVTPSTPEPTTFTIVVTKTDAKTGAALSGAEFTLTDKAGNMVAGWTTDGSAKTFTLDRNTSYVLTEVKAPAGYNREKAININFATVDGKAVVNIDQGSKVVALKNYDSDGNAILNVKDLNGASIQGITTTAQTGDSTNLPLVSLCFAGAALAAGAAASIAYRKKQQH